MHERCGVTRLVHLNAPDEGGCAEVECDPDVAIRAQWIGASRAEHRVCPPFPRAVRGGFPADESVTRAHTSEDESALAMWARCRNFVDVARGQRTSRGLALGLAASTTRFAASTPGTWSRSLRERRSKSRLSRQLIKQGRGTGLNPLSLTRAAIADEVARRDGRRHKRRREGASFITRCRRQEPSGVNVPL